MHASSRPVSAPVTRSLHVGMRAPGTSGQPSTPYSRSSANFASKPIFEMGGIKLQTPVGKVTSRRFAADNLMKSYKENTAALVSHSRLHQVSPATEIEREKTPDRKSKVADRPQSARPAPKEGKACHARLALYMHLLQLPNVSQMLVHAGGTHVQQALCFKR